MSEQLWWRVHSCALFLASLIIVLTPTHSHAVPDAFTAYAFAPPSTSTQAKKKADCHNFFNKVIDSDGQEDTPAHTFAKEIEGMNEEQIRFIRFLTALEPQAFRSFKKDNLPKALEADLWHKHNGINPWWKKAKKREEIEKTYGEIPIVETVRQLVGDPYMRQFLRGHGAEHPWLGTPKATEELSDAFAKATNDFNQAEWDFVLKAFYYGFENPDGSLNIMRPLWLHELLSNAAHFHNMGDVLEGALRLEPEVTGPVPAKFADVIGILESPAAQEAHQVPGHLFVQHLDKSFVVKGHNDVVEKVVKARYGDPEVGYDIRDTIQGLYKAWVMMPTFQRPIELYLGIDTALRAKAAAGRATAPLFEAIQSLDRKELASFTFRAHKSDKLADSIVEALRQKMDRNIQEKRRKPPRRSVQKEKEPGEVKPEPEKPHDEPKNETPAPDLKLTARTLLGEVRKVLSKTKPGPSPLEATPEEIASAKKAAAFFRAVDEQMPERSDIIRAFRMAIIGQTHINFEGPAGTGKSMLARTAESIEESKFFDIQLTRETGIEDVFGPLDVKAYQKGQRKRVLDGHAARAKIAFFDEAGDASIDLRRSLLTLFNERKMRIGGERADAEIGTGITATNMSKFEDMRLNGNRVEAYYDRIPYHAFFPGQLSRLGSVLAMPTRGKLSLPPLAYSDIEALHELSKKVEVSEETHLAAIAIFREMHRETLAEKDRTLGEYQKASRKAQTEPERPYVPTRIYSPRSLNLLPEVIRTGMVDFWMMGDQKTPLLPKAQNATLIKPFLTLSSIENDELATYGKTVFDMDEKSSIRASTLERTIFDHRMNALLEKKNDHPNLEIYREARELADGRTDETALKKITQLIAIVKDGERASEDARSDSYVSGSLDQTADVIARIQAGKQARTILVKWADKQEQGKK